jgi:hypothetical protein
MFTEELTTSEASTVPRLPPLHGCDDRHADPAGEAEAVKVVQGNFRYVEGLAPMGIGGSLTQIIRQRRL